MDSVTGTQNTAAQHSSHNAARAHMEKLRAMIAAVTGKMESHTETRVADGDLEYVKPPADNGPVGRARAKFTSFIMENPGKTIWTRAAGFSASFASRPPTQAAPPTRNYGAADNSAYTYGAPESAGKGGETIISDKGGKFSGGTGNDTIMINAEHAVVHGGDGDDYIRASGRIYGDKGNDRIEGVGNLYGGEGDDTIRGTGNLYGDEGNDWLRGTGNLYGGLGNDRIEGIGNLYGGEGNDRIEGTGDLFGGKGSDLIRGSGNLYGGEGDDTIEVRGSASKAYGGAGNDLIRVIIDSGTIEGGKGDDRIQIIGSASASDAVTVVKFNVGDGKDYVQALHGNVILELGAGFTAENTEISYSEGGRLAIITFDGNEDDQLTINNIDFRNQDASIFTIKFADGSTHELEELTPKYSEIF